MQLSTFPFKQILLKFIIFIILLYVTIIGASFLITGYLFINLDSYKTRIAGVIYRTTGYNLTLDSIRTKINSELLPEIVINNATLSNPSDKNQTISVKHLEFVFSYRSIWNLEPIFKRIYIDNTNINMEYLEDGSIVINGINVNNPDEKTKENLRDSVIDIENWFLKQENIKLSNIDFSFLDKKNNLPMIKVKNLTTTLSNHYLNYHDFSVSLNTARNNQTSIIAKLSWHGGKVTEFNTWDSADFKLQSYNKSDLISEHLKQYLPGLSILDKFNAQTAVSGKIVNSKLQYFHANFDIKNFQYAVEKENNIIDFPQIRGNINIDLINNVYTIRADNLTILTRKGYIFKNKSIRGSSVPDKLGQITLDNTNLKGFNNLLNIIPITKDINIDGDIGVIKYSWQGDFFSPRDYQVNVKFNNLAIISKNLNIPNLNNLSGSLTTNKNHGQLNLNLKNSTLDYKKVFLKNYQFKNFNPVITWKINQESHFEISLNKTAIQMDDFTGYAVGKYIYNPDTMGYLELKAHIDKLATSHVGDYLPIVIGKPVHKWLNMALIGGYGTNASLDLRGNLEDFPFKNGKGVFYIDATIDNAKLRYVEDWPTLDDINGKFMIRNQSILIEAKEAKVNGNNISNAKVEIPDMTSKDAYLTATGIANGSTKNFMAYLKDTPINEIIGKIPEKIAAKGEGLVDLKLKVPFDNPEKSEVNGSYKFINNEINLDMPIPTLSNVNGKLDFSDKGMRIDSLTTHVLDSNANIAAITAKSGDINLRINIPNLDYKSASSFYAPYLSPLIVGRSNTLINVTIDKKGLEHLTVNSNLNGVTINTPKPLDKIATTTSNFGLEIKRQSLADSLDFSLNYANLIFGKFQINEGGNFKDGYFSLGTNQFANKTNNNPKITVTVKLREVYTLKWIDTLIEAINADKKTNIDMEQDLFRDKDKNKTQNIFPIEALIDTQNLYFAETNYQRAYMDILANDNNVIFNLNSVLANGYGKFNYTNNQLEIFMYNFHYRESLNKLKERNALNKSSIPFAAKLNNYLAKVSPPGKKDQNYNKLNSLQNPKVKTPNTTLKIDKLWFENQILGSVMVNLIPKGSDLIIESGTLTGPKISQIYFNGVNYCMECGPDKAYVDLQSYWEIFDFGKFLDNLGYKNIIAKGKGSLNTSIQFNGRISDFDINRTIASINLDIKDGKFLKIDTTSSILATIIGIMNLQYITSFINVGFTNIFSNGFYFNQLKMQAYLINSKVDIKSLYIWGATATVNSKGVIDIEHDTVNMDLSVTPHLSAGVAIGVGVATLNPLIGVAAYAAEMLLGAPVSKLFTFSFKITGPLQNPTIKQISVTKQVTKNVNSVVNTR